MAQKTEEQDIMWLDRSIQMAVMNSKAGGGPFGALIIKGGEVVGRGVNRVSAHNDPTAHAEVEAIRDAGGSLQSFDLSGCTIYSSCEPCPMCLSAIYWARIDRLVYGTSREDAEKAGFRDAELYREVAMDPAHRQLPSLHLHSDQSGVEFQVWMSNPGRIEY